MITKRVVINKAKSKKILKELQGKLGEKRATDNPAVLFTYSGTSMVLPKAMPDFVVMPKEVEEVQFILGIARKYKLPVTPVASASQEPPTYPFFGGIVIDSMSMNKII